MNTIKSLQEFGLNEKESKVYLELLKLGLVNVGPIVKKCNFHRQFVYDALDKLVEVHLASYVIKNKLRLYQAASPNTLMQFIEDKERIAKMLIPELMSLQESSKEKVSINVLYGTKGFFDNLKGVIVSAANTDGIMRIIGGGKDSDFYRILGDNYDEYVELLNKYGVKKELLAPEDFSTEFKNKFAAEKLTTLKTLKYGLSSTTYTRITPEMTSIEIYTKEPIVIQIYNPEVAKGYMDHFQILWQQAELYKSKP